jgi:hypothetical protein
MYSNSPHAVFSFQAVAMLCSAFLRLLLSRKSTSLLMML